MATHSNTLAWKILWMEEPGRLRSMGSLGIRQDWATSLSLFTFMHWRRKWRKSQTRLSDFSFFLSVVLLEKEMATHSSILAWKILWMEEPGRLQSMGSQRLRHDWATSLSFFFKGFIEFVTILLLFFVLFFWPGDVGSWLSDQGLNLYPLCWKVKS